MDGTIVLSGGNDRRVKVLNRADGAEIRNLNVHTGPVIGVGFMGANGFYSLGEDATLSRWNRTTYDVVERYEYPAKPTAATLIGNELYVATSDPVATWVYNMDGLLLRWLEHPPSEGKITQYLVDPTGKYIITGRETGKKIVKLTFMGFDAGEEEKISRFSSWQFWETGRGIFRGSLAHSHPMNDAQVSDDGLRIFSQDPKRTMLWTFGAGSMVEAERLMETGYFIAPRFTGMDFTADNSILATRVGVSIFMLTPQQLAGKTLTLPAVPLPSRPKGPAWRPATAKRGSGTWPI